MQLGKTTNKERLKVKHYIHSFTLLFLIIQVTSATKKLSSYETYTSPGATVYIDFISNNSY